MNRAKFSEQNYLQFLIARTSKKRRPDRVTRRSRVSQLDLPGNIDTGYARAIISWLWFDDEHNSQ
jgi:hypothetical protein